MSMVEAAWQTPRGDSAGSDALRRAGHGLIASGSATPRGGGGGGLYPGGLVAPSVRPSGKAGDLAEAGGPWARRGLQPDIIVATPRTPEHLNEVQRRHRQKGNPGERALHYGLKNVKVPPAGEGYGVKPAKGDDVAQTFLAGQKLGVAEYLSNKKESIYMTNIREPLGRPWCRGHKLPDHVLRPEFKGYGNASLLSAFGTKELVFPRNVDPDSEEMKEQYKKTHQSYGPGESVNRRYLWPQVIVENPHHAFGVPENVERGGGGTGAKTALTMDCGDEPLSAGKTPIVSAVQANYDQASKDQLATSRCSTRCVPPVHPGFFYGVKSAADECNAGQLVRGNYTVDEQQPDADLGRSIVPGRRNFVTKAPLGIPTVRTDIKAPPLERRSVSNSTNWGDDPDALGVIFPGKYQWKGVNEADFKALRSRAELRSILEGAGYQLTDDEFEEIVFNAAAGQSNASVEATMEAALEWSFRCGGALTQRGAMAKTGAGSQRSGAMTARSDRSGMTQLTGSLTPRVSSAAWSSGTVCASLPP